jgi:hypothetical protein
MVQMIIGAVMTVLAGMLLAPTCGNEPNSLEGFGGRMLGILVGTLGVGFAIYGFQQRTGPGRMKHAVEGMLRTRTATERLATMVGRSEEELNEGEVLHVLHDESGLAVIRETAARALAEIGEARETLVALRALAEVRHESGDLRAAAGQAAERVHQRLVAVHGDEVEGRLMLAGPRQGGELGVLERMPSGTRDAGPAEG